MKDKFKDKLSEILSSNCDFGSSKGAMLSVNAMPKAISEIYTLHQQALLKAEKKAWMKGSQATYGLNKELCEAKIKDILQSIKSSSFILVGQSMSVFVDEIAKENNITL